MSKKQERVGGGSTYRPPPLSQRGPPEEHLNTRRREVKSMFDEVGDQMYNIDSNLDKNATSLTERREHAALYYDGTVIAPLWMKVSSTPWTAFANAAGGYGRKIDDTSVSHDCPSFMHIPEVMSHKPNISMCGEFSGTTKKKVQARNSYSISDDAPDWFKTPSVVEWKRGRSLKPNPMHRKMVLGKEIIFEPKTTNDEAEKPIDWSVPGKSTATSSKQAEFDAQIVRLGGVPRSLKSTTGNGGGNETARQTARRMMYDSTSAA